MGMDYSEYMEWKGLRPVGFSKSFIDPHHFDQLQQQGLSLLASEPAWSVYTEKLTETLEQHRAVVRAIESKLLDVDRPLSVENYYKLQPQLAYARGYIKAVETALDLVLQSQTKKESSNA